MHASTHAHAHLPQSLDHAVTDSLSRSLSSSTLGHPRVRRANDERRYAREETTPSAPKTAITLACCCDAHAQRNSLEEKSEAVQQESERSKGREWAPATRC
eukprot:4917739-Pleurochrysis_carterae.AAC.1